MALDRETTNKAASAGSAVLFVAWPLVKRGIEAISALEWLQSAIRGMPNWLYAYALAFVAFWAGVAWADDVVRWLWRPWPDFEKWDKVDKFRIYQAACLWNDVEPTLPMPRSARKTYRKWKNMFLGGGLPVNLRPHYTLDETYALATGEDAFHPDIEIHRGVLETLAEMDKRRPMFLFKSERAR
jgi:hypothetical protein